MVKSPLLVQIRDGKNQIVNLIGKKAQEPALFLGRLFSVIQYSDTL